MELTEQSIGHITQLMRYPVKSMAGESLPETLVVHTGLYGDRGYALIDETKEGWSRYVTARQIPQLLSFRATLAAGAEEGGPAIPPIRIESEDGRTFEWNKTLLAEIQPSFKRDITLHTCAPEDELLAVDSGAILIVTEQTVERLGALLGRSVDWRRFRPNIVLMLADGLFEREQELVGKRLRFGDAVVEINEACERCSVITIDPDTLEKDPEILKLVHRELGLQFGLYASVVQPGRTKLGDRVYLIEKTEENVLAGSN